MTTAYSINVQCTPAGGDAPRTFISKQGDRIPVSPLFGSLAELYPWMRTNGWRSAGTQGNAWGCERCPVITIAREFDTLAEAVAASGMDLSYNPEEARRSIAATERDVEIAWLTPEGEVYYVFVCDIRILHKFEPFHSCMDDSPFRILFREGDRITDTGITAPKTRAARVSIASQQLENRNLLVG